MSRRPFKGVVEVAMLQVTNDDSHTIISARYIQSKELVSLEDILNPTVPFWTGERANELRWIASSTLVSLGYEEYEWSGAMVALVLEEMVLLLVVVLWLVESVPHYYFYFHRHHHVCTSYCQAKKKSNRLKGKE